MFYALWPDAATHTALAALSREAHAVAGGRVTRADTLHLTMAFIGDIPAARVDTLPPLDTLAAGTAPFTLTLDQIGWWRHNRIVWCAPQASEALSALQANLAAAVRGAGFALDTRPFSPHLTLIRRAERAPQGVSMRLVEWRVEELLLVESVQARGSGAGRGGARYQTIGRWPLGRQR